MEKVKPNIEKQAARMRIPTLVDKKLATCESFESLMYQFHRHRKTILLFVPMVFQAIYDTLKKDELNDPNTKEQ